MNDGLSFLMLIIESDYAGGCHKSQLHVDEKRLGLQLEEVWKSIKTKKLLYLNAYFTEIDYYDNETDIYYTPSVFIKRGLKRAKIGEDSHGAIPKDWTYKVVAKIKETTTITPIIEVIKKVLYSKFTKEIEKKFIKELRPVLQKKKESAQYYGESDEE
jgi:hypothetical protein